MWRVNEGVQPESWERCYTRGLRNPHRGFEIGNEDWLENWSLPDLLGGMVYSFTSPLAVGGDGDVERGPGQDQRTIYARDLEPVWLATSYKSAS